VNFKDGFAARLIESGLDTRGSALKDDGVGLAVDEWAKLRVARQEALLDGARVGRRRQIDTHGQRVHRQNHPVDWHSQRKTLDGRYRRHTLALRAVRRFAGR
jgi:IS5 family transposase